MECGTRLQHFAGGGLVDWKYALGVDDFVINGVAVGFHGGSVTCDRELHAPWQSPRRSGGSIRAGARTGIANIRIGKTPARPEPNVAHTARMSADILHVQRTLRTRLFEGPQAIRWRPGRELVAHMLLYLDDAPALLAHCYGMGAIAARRRPGGWRLWRLCRRARVGAGLCGAGRGAACEPASCPAQGLRFNAASPCLRNVWREPTPVLCPKWARTRLHRR